MKKLRLKLDALRVDSFDTDARPRTFAGSEITVAGEESREGSCVSACGLCATPDWACLAQ
jgi:hypothetical protein